MLPWRQNRLKKATAETYRFKVKVIKETSMAYYVDVDGLKEWVPKSKCEIGLDPTGNFYCMDIPEWLAKEKGLI